MPGGAIPSTHQLHFSEAVSLHSPTSLTDPQKIGIRNSPGWGAYILEGQYFLKLVKSQLNQPHPDFGCNWEIYTNSEMLELETLSPLTSLKSCGGSVEHVERWVVGPVEAGLHDGALLDFFSELAQ